MDPINPINQEVPVPQPESKDRHWIMIAAMGGFVAASLVIVGFLYYQNQQLKSMLASYQGPTSAPIPVATVNPTANWKTYTNLTYNFGINYPFGWIVNENPVGDPKAAKNSIRLAKDSASIYISIFNEYGGACPITGYQKIVINGQSKDVCISDTTGGKAWGQITFQRSGYIVELRGYATKETPEELLIPQILSTFKFLDTEANLPPCRADFPVEAGPELTASENYSRQCTIQTTEAGCKSVDNYNAKTKDFSKPDGIPDCIWGNE